VFAAVVAIALVAPFVLALLGLPLGLGVYVVVQQPFADPVLTMVCAATLITAGALAIVWPLKAILTALIHRRDAPEQLRSQPRQRQRFRAVRKLQGAGQSGRGAGQAVQELIL
jgi:hypothetical protein